MYYSELIDTSQREDWKNVQEYKHNFVYPFWLIFALLKDGQTGRRLNTGQGRIYIFQCFFSSFVTKTIVAILVIPKCDEDDLTVNDLHMG